MKVFVFFIIASAALWLCVPFACSKKVEGRTDNLAALQPAKTDSSAGTWKTILLAGPTDIAVAAPIATSNPDYIAQVNEIKSFQASMSGSDKDIVQYWSAGAVLRWNEILRELVAKHNLPPYQNTDDTYPIPSANNPLAYPQFPFSNPPYAARAYAYVSAAIYDALVSAYYYKKLYNRTAPYNVDVSVNVMVPRTTLPSYPSEDGVVEGAAVEMLKLLFPGDQDYVTQKAAEHKRARMLTGANVRSDIETGEALGKAVAQVYEVRARADRAGASVGTQTQWTQFQTTAIAQNQIPWYSLEAPVRPPMLPIFGKVKGFLIDSLSVIALRPAPPPSTSSDQMKKDIADVHAMIKNDSRAHYDIVLFWADGIGTSTPPGHWNAIAAADFITKNFSEVRWARNLALLNMAEMDAAIVCWDTKYFYFNPRPTQMDAAIKTLTGIPNFPSYISGHASFSGAASAILGQIIPERAAAYTAMANEAAMSRYYAGIHYKIDSDSGLTVGYKVGNFAVQRALTDGAN
ncbi:MAG: phosphatase PAP2 family protein [Bacteroidota bacterium]